MADFMDMRYDAFKKHLPGLKKAGVVVRVILGRPKRPTLIARPDKILWYFSRKEELRRQGII
jgi:hypothetical protein